MRTRPVSTSIVTSNVNATQATMVTESHVTKTSASKIIVIIMRLVLTLQMISNVNATQATMETD